MAKGKKSDTRTGGLHWHLPLPNLVVVPNREERDQKQGQGKERVKKHATEQQEEERDTCSSAPVTRDETPSYILVST